MIKLGTKLKGMNFAHNFGNYFPLFSSLLKKREEEKKNELAKSMIKSHAFQPSPNYEISSIKNSILKSIIINLNSIKLHLMILRTFKQTNHILKHH